MKTKAILFDPNNEEIKEVTIDSWKDISPLIGCDCFCCVNVNGVDTAYVDDNGLMNGTSSGAYFSFYPNVLAGKVLFLGSNEEGETIDTTLTVADVKKMVVSTTFL